MRGVETMRKNREKKMQQIKEDLLLIAMIDGLFLGLFFCGMII